MEGVGVPVNLLSGTHSCSYRHAGCSYVIYSSDESFEFTLDHLASVYRVSSDPGGNASSKTGQGPSDDLGSQVLVAMTPGHQRKLGNVYLETCDQVLKNIEKIINLVMADNLCKMMGFSITYK